MINKPNNNYEYSYEKEYKKAIKKNPKDIRAYINFSKNLLNSKRYREAKSILIKAIDIDPTLPEIYILLAQTSYENKERAEVYFKYSEKAYLISPDDIDSIVCYGSFNLIVGNYTKALELLEQARLIKPDSYAINRNLVLCYFRKGYINKAIKYSLTLIR